MKIEELKSLDKRKENFYVLLSIIIILIFSLTLIYFTKKSEDIKSISNTQISSFDSFNNDENAIYSDIYNYLYNLEFFAKDEGYSNIEKLEDDNVAPFVKDELWSKRGSIDWNYLVIDNKNYYIGISRDENIGNFLIESSIENDKVTSKVYYLKSNISNIIEASDKENKLKKIIDEKVFKEVIPLTGNDIGGK